jgi:hypothetical protein
MAEDFWRIVPRIPRDAWPSARSHMGFAVAGSKADLAFMFGGLGGECLTSSVRVHMHIMRHRILGSERKQRWLRLSLRRQSAVVQCPDSLRNRYAHVQCGLRAGS